MIYNRIIVALTTRARGDTVFLLQRATKFFYSYYIMSCTVLALLNHVYTRRRSASS